MSQLHLAVDKRLNMPSQLTLGSKHSLGYRPYFAEVRGVEGDNAVSFPQSALFKDNGLSLVGLGLHLFGRGKLLQDLWRQLFGNISLLHAGGLDASLLRLLLQGLRIDTLDHLLKLHLVHLRGVAQRSFTAKSRLAVGPPERGSA